MKRLLAMIMGLLTVQGALAWGQKGHDTVAYIAECHLTPEAAARVSAIFHGYSPVYYSNWMDNASHTPEYAYTSTWHYYNIDEGQTLETMPRHPKGDVLSAIAQLTEQLGSGTLTPEKEAEALKMLVHLVGDMHCPMHAGRQTDRGGNNVPVVYFGRPAKLHSIWDSDLIESAHRWSFTEWQQQIDRLPEEEAAEAIKGTPEEWFMETAAIAAGIYADTPEGTKISYDYVNKYAPVIEQQLVRGGLRLASILNNLYSTPVHKKAKARKRR